MLAKISVPKFLHVTTFFCVGNKSQCPENLLSTKYLNDDLTFVPYEDITITITSNHIPLSCVCEACHKLRLIMFL